MRTGVGLLAAAAMVLGLGAVQAGAASPIPRAAFSGSGHDYINSTPEWRVKSAGRFTFQTDSNGGRMLAFRGTYSDWCAGQTATVTASYLTVTSAGSFAYRFTHREKHGRDYVEIWGEFQHGGKSTDVNYLVDYVATGKKVPHPYDTTHPHSLGCGSLVEGVAAAK